MFGSTYQREQLFSVINGNRSPVRNCVNNPHVGSILKVVSANKISPEIGKIVSEKRCQVSGRKQ